MSLETSTAYFLIVFLPKLLTHTNINPRMQLLCCNTDHEWHQQLSHNLYYLKQFSLVSEDKFDLN